MRVALKFAYNGKNFYGYARQPKLRTIEEEIIQGIGAQKDGVKGIICGPVAANTIEKVVDIPVISIRFEKKLLLKCIENMANKV